MLVPTVNAIPTSIRKAKTRGCGSAHVGQAPSRMLANRRKKMKQRVSVTRIFLLLVVVTFGLTSLFAQEKNPDRNAYFGETHIHTSWSFDAYVFGNTKAGPEESYKFAIGQPIDHPAGYKIKITRPLDFMAVTDHAEYVGTVPLANDPNSPISKLPIAEKLKVRSKEDINRVYMFLGSFPSQERAHPGAGEPRGGG